MEEPLPKLSWFPLYVEKILSSSSWLQMKDYQRGWYIQLLLLSAHSVRPGYLPLDGSLWRLAGARTKQYFEQESVVVMACFKRRQMDGREWIYNERLVRVLEQQARRQMDFDRRGKKGSGKDDQRQTSLSFSSSTISISPDLIQKTVEELFEYYCNTFTKRESRREVARALPNFSSGGVFSCVNLFRAGSQPRATPKAQAASAVIRFCR